MAKKDKGADGAPADGEGAEVKTVKMVRKTPAHAGGPTEADVHPDQVEAFLDKGWREA